MSRHSPAALLNQQYSTVRYSTWVLQTFFSPSSCCSHLTHKPFSLGTHIHRRRRRLRLLLTYCPRTVAASSSFLLFVSPPDARVRK